MTADRPEGLPDYPPLPECDHAADCICIEFDHSHCCGNRRVEFQLAEAAQGAAPSFDATRAALADVMSLTVDHLDEPRMRVIHKAASRGVDAQGAAPRAEGLACAACGQTDLPVVMVPLHPRCDWDGTGAAPRAEGPHPLLVKYGLEGMAGDPIEVLHRHLTNNHEATIGAYKATIRKLREGAAPRAEGLDVDVLLAAERVVQGWDDEITEGGMTPLIEDLRQSLERRITVLSRPSDERRTPIVEVVGNGDGTMNVLTEDGMRWRLTEDEYRAWPRRPSDERVPESENARA